MTEQRSDSQQLVPQSQVPHDWYALIDLVTDSVTSPHTKRAYSRALIDFFDWYEANGRPGFGKATVNAYRAHMLQEEKSQSSINQALSAILAVILGAGLRRAEAAGLTWEQIQQRDGRCAIIDLVGKRNRVRSIGLPPWVKVAVDRWAAAVGVQSGNVFRALTRTIRPFSTASLGVQPGVW